MNAKPADSTPKQWDFLKALIDCGSVLKAAENTGISQPTAWRYQQLKPFKREYRKACISKVERSFAVAQHVSEAVMSILFEIARDEEQPVSARIAACNSLKEHAVRGVEVVDHEERLAEIEETLNRLEGSDSQKGRLRVA